MVHHGSYGLTGPSNYNCSNVCNRWALQQKKDHLHLLYQSDLRPVPWIGARNAICTRMVDGPDMEDNRDTICTWISMEQRSLCRRGRGAGCTAVAARGDLVTGGGPSSRGRRHWVLYAKYRFLFVTILSCLFWFINQVVKRLVRLRRLELPLVRDDPTIIFGADMARVPEDLIILRPYVSPLLTGTNLPI